MHKKLPEAFTKTFKTYPWLHSICRRWPSLKRFCGAVFEERPSARSLFGAPVRRVPPRPLVRPGYSERRLGDGSSRVERVRILGLAGASCWVREDRDLLEPTSCSFGWTGSRGPTPPRTGAGTPDVKWVKLFFQNYRGGVDLSPETSKSVPLHQNLFN